MFLAPKYINIHGSNSIISFLIRSLDWHSDKIIWDRDAVCLVGENISNHDIQQALVEKVFVKCSGTVFSLFQNL